VNRERRRRCDLVANELREVARALVGRLRPESADQALSMSTTAMLAHLHRKVLGE
jgi:hypothetical protein